MAIPLRGDPSRPVAQAVRAARMLGAVVLILAATSVAITWSVMFQYGSVELDRFLLLMLGAVTVFYVLPGTLFLVFAAYLKRLKTWAAICLMALGGLTALVSGLSVARGLVVLANVGGWDLGIRFGTQLFQFAAIAAELVGSILLIVHCARAVRAIPLLAAHGNVPLGFQPVMPVPFAEPVEPEDATSRVL